MFSLNGFSRMSLWLVASLFAHSSLALTSSAGCTFSTSSSSTSSVAATSPLSCSVTVTGQWTGGYQVDLKVKNNGTVASDKWQVVLNVPMGDSLSSMWNGQLNNQQGNAYAYDNLSWNGVIQPGGSASIGAIINNNDANHGVPTCQIVVPYQNTAPVAEISAEVKGATVEVHTLNASDADGDKLIYSIDFGDGKTLNTANAWHTYKTPGSYTVTAKISDSKSYITRSQTVVVGAAGSQHAPVAALSYSAYRTQATLNASGSADVDGDSLSYQWDLGQGALPAGDQKTEIATLGYGGAWITLTVFDGTLGDTAEIFVPYSHCSYKYSQPTADFTTAITGSTLKLDASASAGADSYTWDFGDGTVGNGMFTSHSYNGPGSYTVKLTSASAGFTAEKTITVDITTPAINLPPILQFSCGGYAIFEDDFVNHISTQSFNANCELKNSSDPEGKPLYYFVNWNDTSSNQSSSSSSGGNSSYFFHHYSSLQPGYSITLGVSDGVNWVTKNIRISQYGYVDTNTAPVACFEMSGSSALSVNAACSSDADGDSLTYSWDFGDGTSATGVTAEHSYTAAGSYTVLLKVADSKTQSYSSKTFVYTVAAKTTVCSFKINNQWAGGYNGSFIIKNEGTSPVSNWEALLTFPANETISSKFNGTFSGTNPLTVKPPVWATTLQPGASQEVGFLVWKTDISLPVQGPVIAGPNCQ